MIYCGNTMTEGTQTQEVDEHVSNLIESYGQEFGIDIDPKNPSRKLRLELALKLDEGCVRENQWSAMEIMVGRKINPQEMQYVVLFMSYRVSGTDRMQFYEGFP